MLGSLLDALMGGMSGIGNDSGAGQDSMSAIRDMAFGDDRNPQIFNEQMPDRYNPMPSGTAGPGGFAGMMSPPMGGIPQNAPGSNAPAAALPDQQADIAVSGFKPTKRSFIGRLADAWVVSQGGKPLYEQHLQEKDMHRAMEGFTTDPLESIRRMSQIPGMEGKAWELYNQYLDNTRGSDSEARQRAAAESRIQEVGRDRIGAFARSTLNGDGSVNTDAFSKALPTILAYGQSKGIDMTDFPTDGDPQKLNTWIMGSVKTKDQIRQEETADYHQGSLDARNHSTDVREDHYNATEGQAATNEEGRDTRNATNEAGRNTRQDKSIANKPKAYKEGDVKVNPKDKTRAARLEKGKWKYYKRLPNGHWKYDE